MASTSRAAAVSAKETEPCQRRSKRLRRLQEDKRAKDDSDGRLEYKNFLIEYASEWTPGQPTALLVWICDATQGVEEDTCGASEDRVAAASLMTAGDLADVVAAAPRMTKAKDNYDRTPVHYALEWDAKDWVLDRLLSVCVGADLLETSGGMTPLHEAARKDRSFEVFKLILEAAGKYAPELARKGYPGASGGFAFHKLCSKKTVDDRTLHLLIDTMVSGTDNEERHPLSVTDWKGETPLHVAARLGAGVSVLKKMVAFCPDALMVAPRNITNIPLLEAVDSFPDSHNAESIRFLINAWPEGVRFKSHGRRTLIHRPLPDDILEEALKIWPDGIKCPDLLTRNGKLQMNPQHAKFILSRLSRDRLSAFAATMPLHKHQVVLDEGWDEKQVLQTVVALVESCPDVLKARDKNGWTPLHFRRWNSFAEPHSTFKFMMQQNPCELYTPVKELWHTEDVGDRVLERSFCEPTIVSCFLPRRDSSNRNRPTRYLVDLLRHTLVNGDQVPPLHIVASHSAGHHDAYAKTVAFVHQLDPSSIRQEVSDAVTYGGKGRLPLHVACAQPDCRADNLQLLLDLYKPASNVADTKGLYPFTIAACNKSASVECLFLLLRQGPNVLFH